MIVRKKLKKILPVEFFGFLKVVYRRELVVFIDFLHKERKKRKVHLSDEK